MRSPFIILSTLISLLICLFVACANDEHNNDSNNIKNSSKDSARLNPDSVLTGDWVNEKYVNLIRGGMLIADAQHEGIQVSFDRHDKNVGYANLYFHAGPGPFTITKGTNDYLFHGNVFGTNDTLFNVKIITPDKIVIGNEPYLKIHSIEDDGAPAIVEEYLFKGKFIMKNGHEVEFTEDGNVAGLDTIQYYSAENDYTGGPDFEVNRISMGRDTKNQHGYGFKFTGDTLFICEVVKDVKDTTDDPSGYKRSLGKMIYKMWRKKQ